VKLSDGALGLKKTLARRGDAGGPWQIGVGKEDHARWKIVWTVIFLIDVIFPDASEPNHPNHPNQKSKKSQFRQFPPIHETLPTPHLPTPLRSAILPNPNSPSYPCPPTG
jgi:hypothetical protein